MSFLSVWLLSSSTDPSGSEWAFAMTGVRDLQARGLDGAGQTVCLVDTGIDATHPDFAFLRLTAWRDFVRGRATPYDDDGHGTAMAGLLAASGSFRGIAPGVALIVAKVLDAQGRGTSASLAAAIDFCIDPDGDGNSTDGASVINLSLASASDLPVGSDVLASINTAVAKGVVLVASAGNDGLTDDGDVQAPASAQGVIAVGAVDEYGGIAPFSSIGAAAGRVDPNRKPELVAPGVDLLTTARSGGYRLVAGTSPAAAIVSGIVALLLQSHPGLSHSGTASTVFLLKAVLAETAQKRAGQVVPHDPHYGYGLIVGGASAAALG